MPRDLTDLEAHLKPEVEPWQRVLLDAAKEVRKGWARFSMCDTKGRVCAIGALARVQDMNIHTVSHDDVERTDAAQRLREGIGYDIDVWNDTRARSAEEVASTMERVAGIGAMLGGR